MPKKFAGENTKVTAAKEKKAANKAKEDAKRAEEAEGRESSEWAKGAKGKSKKDAEAEKKAAAAAKKAEAARLLAEEEKAIAKSKPVIRAPKGEEKKALKKSAANESVSNAVKSLPTYSASGIDDALDALSLATDEKSVGVAGKAKDLEKHPERRFKAALTAYEERNMDRVKEENPGLRRTQLKELIYKEFQKSEENPFNQGNIIDYNATREQESGHIAEKRKALEERLRSD